MFKSMLAGLVKMFAPFVEEFTKTAIQKFLDHLTKQSGIPAGVSALQADDGPTKVAIDATVQDMLNS